MASELTAGGRLVLGSAQWAQSYGIANRVGPPDPDELRRILDTASQAGVRTIDTARGYGHAEVLVGAMTGSDSRWEVVTKLAPGMSTADGSAPAAVEAAQRSLEASRQALQRDRLDVVLLHRASDRLAHGGAIWRWLIEERRRGTVGGIGVSADSPEEALAALDDPELNATQVATSLLDQRLVRAGFFARAGERGIRTFVRSIFLQGVAHLSPEEIPAHLFELTPALAEIQQWAAARGQPVAAPYLLFARTLPASVVIGVERSHQLVEILRIWSGLALPEDELRTLTDLVPEFRPELLTPSLWPAASHSQ